MSFLARVRLVFTHGKELEFLLNVIRRDKEHAEWKARQHHLHLCVQHQQERNRSHYSEKNCDYCKLLARVNNDT